MVRAPREQPRVITTSPSQPVNVMEDAYDPTVFIFDAYPGGIGFSENLFDRHDELMHAVRSVITSCPCEHGCPMCVGPLLEVGPSAKDAAVQYPRSDGKTMSLKDRLGRLTGEAAKPAMTDRRGQDRRASQEAGQGYEPLGA